MASMPFRFFGSAAESQNYEESAYSLLSPSPEGDVKGKTEWLPHPKGGRDNVYKAENLTCGEGGRRKDYIVEDGDNRMEIQGFVRSGFRTFATWCLIVLSGFLLRLLFHWKPHWFLRCTHRRTTLALATRLEITQIYKKWKDHFVRPVLSMERPVAVSKRADSSHRPTTPWAPLRVASAILDISRHDHSVQLHPSLSTAVLVDSPADERISAPEIPAGSSPTEGPPTGIPVPVGNGEYRYCGSVRFFTLKRVTYVWEEEGERFRQLGGLDGGTELTNDVILSSRGLTTQQAEERYFLHGPNKIRIGVKSVFELLFLEVLNPFYIFQLFAVALWFSDQYVVYASAIVLLSAWGISSTILLTRRNQRALKSMVLVSDTVEVQRPGVGGACALETVPADALVPGDVIAIPSHGCQLHCDAVMLTGSCIVDEGMLTGESVPVTKTPLPPRPRGLSFDSDAHARHTLFCGTRVIQTRFYEGERVLALVVNTGYATAKGKLVRAIMFPHPVDFKFSTDAYRFILVLAAIAAVGFVYTVVTKYLRGVSPGDIALDSLDLLTIVVPPALPAAMTVGIVVAAQRLKDKKIFCISPRAINISGLINCVCFDKTGTLTEDGMDMWGVVPVTPPLSSGSGGSGEAPPTFRNAVTDLSTLDSESPLTLALVTCHSLTLIEGELLGDPLDLKMFQSTGWELEEPSVADSAKYDMVLPTVVRPPASGNNKSLEVAVLRQFPFSSKLQRMTVIGRVLSESHFRVFAKGSPEMITKLCTPETIPSDFDAMLKQYTQHGYRVLGLACADLRSVKYAKLHRLTREEVEKDLHFLGLLVFENKIKEVSPVMIATLRSAAIRCLMVTGDNVETATSVSRQVGLVSSDEDLFLLHFGAGDRASELEWKELHLAPVACSSVTQVLPTKGSPGESRIEFGALVPEPPFVQPDLDLSCLSPQPHAGADKEADVVVVSQYGSLHQKVQRLHNRYQFALSGNTFQKLVDLDHPSLPHVLTRGAVFARMSPEQKQVLVEKLQELGYCVGMCGDGANDCGALRCAHAGISLSEAEASVASPFTSKEPDISCVPKLVAEGRAALVTSFGIFKYMACYSLTQFVSVMILYSIDNNLGDWQYLFIDLCLITVLAALFGLTEAYSGPLNRLPPPGSLVSLPPILSLLAQICLVITVQVFMFFHVQRLPWFTPYEHKPDDDDATVASYENFAVFSSANFQYVILAAVFSRASPYRAPLYTNKLLSLALVLLLALCVWVVVSPPSFLVDLLELKLPPMPEGTTFIVTILAAAAINFILAFLVEYVFINRLLARQCLPRFHRIETCKRRYLHLDQLMSRSSQRPYLPSDPSWAVPENQTSSAEPGR